jgi:hypothetical protein
MTAIELSPEEMSKVAAKKDKKKKRSRDDDDSNTTEVDARKQKKEKKQLLLQQVPERDEDGIAYTKLQRRRMMKRVKRGLVPVPTPREESERIQNEAQLKREEEAELAGMIYENDVEEEDDDDKDDDNEKDDDDAMEEEPVAAITDNAPAKQIKKSKRAKEVPIDYVCSACKNKHTPLHWIYDCPDKITMRGTNQVSKKSKGVYDPDLKKVFVSGLSFDAKRKDVETLFSSCGKLVQCKLLTFDDTGRCKGQAYLTFESESSAKTALAMSGTTVENTASSDSKKEVKRKELKLKVTKMLNRFATKKGTR